MIDRASLLVADLERIPGLLRAHMAPGPIRPVGSPAGTLRRIVLTGLGSSRCAALAAAPLLRGAGLEVTVEHASVARPTPVGRDALVVAISASGRTPETIAAVTRARSAGARTLAITNRLASPLTAASDVVLDLGAGDEASGIASLTHAATLATLVRLAAGLGADVDPAAALGSAADAAERLLETRPAWLVPAAAALDGSDAVHVIADADALGTAEQAALLLREGPRLLADATDAGDWLHVGIYTALPGYRALLLAGTAYDAELVAVIAGRGGRLVAIGRPVDGAAASIRLWGAAESDPLARAFVEALASALLAAELWRRTGARDLSAPA